MWVRGLGHQVLGLGLAFQVLVKITESNLSWNNRLTVNCGIVVVTGSFTTRAKTADAIDCARSSVLSERIFLHERRRRRRRGPCLVVPDSVRRCPARSVPRRRSTAGCSSTRVGGGFGPASSSGGSSVAAATAFQRSPAVVDVVVAAEVATRPVVGERRSASRRRPTGSEIVVVGVRRLLRATSLVTPALLARVWATSERAVISVTSFSADRVRIVVFVQVAGQRSVAATRRRPIARRPATVSVAPNSAGDVVSAAAFGGTSSSRPRREELVKMVVVDERGSARRRLDAEDGSDGRQQRVFAVTAAASKVVHLQRPDERSGDPLLQQVLRLQSPVTADSLNGRLELTLSRAHTSAKAGDPATVKRTQGETYG